MFGGRGMGMDKMRLIASDQVRKELNVTEEQASKIDEIAAAYREESRGLFSGMRGRDRDMSQEERAKAREEMTKKRGELLKKHETKLMAALKEAQVKRLNQIWLQQQGVEALTSKHVVDNLKLSKDQVAKIKATFETRTEEMQKLMADMRAARQGGGDRSGFAEMREKMDAIGKKAEDAALAVLNAEQKKKFEELKGEKFELDRRSMFRRGGRGRGEGGGQEGGRQRRPRQGETI
jgi:hypothetical protein